jgi:hypothetical protein
MGTGRVVLWQNWNDVSGSNVLSRIAFKRSLTMSSYLDMIYHPWGGAQKGEAPACGKDAPVDLDDCDRCHIIIQVGGDRKAALSRIDEAVNNRLKLLQRHRLHRLCNVRAMLRQFESGLEGARQYTRRILEFVSEFPDAPTMKDDA